MSVVQQLHVVSRYNTIRTAEDANGDVFFCNMHSDLAKRPGRACFRTILVDEILNYQQALADRLRLDQQHKGDQHIKHVVLASDSDVFNLGGDLELFCELIRKGDRIVVPRGDTRIAEGDLLTIFALRDSVIEVEQLFQAGLDFF